MKRSGIAPGALPLLGHALPLWRRPLEFLSELPDHGDLVELRLGPKRAYIACDPETTRQMLLQPRIFDKGGPLFETARRLVGNGLVASLWEEHRRQRRMVQPSFHQARMPKYAELMLKEIDQELASWAPGHTVDILQAMHDLTLRIAARTMFSSLISDETATKVQEFMPVILRGVYVRTVAPVDWLHKLPTAANRRYDYASAGMKHVITQMINDHHRSGTDRGDLLSMLMSARDGEDGDRLSDEEIHNQVMTLIVGGTETTGNATASALQMLALNPDVERRMHTEVDEVLGGRQPSFEDLPRLDYCYRVLYETLRLRPPVWLVTRTTTRDTELAGRQLRSGTTLFYSPYLLHLNPDLFPEPERFDPDRWLPGRNVDLPPGAMLPFGLGSRKCIGDKFGLAEITLTLAAIASRWQLRIVPGEPTKTRTAPEMTLGTGPLTMVVERRVSTRPTTGGPSESAPPPSRGCPYSRTDESQG
ncbi:cytochrome P450 [Streptomyces umbrinus]|uniref:cytochrome P450 n=1 Tax=Streptomyces umbrinus TaxID=67370 RepID=UPI0027D870C6|nr:cytochrome P450 [Streptomyces umbrinus]